MFQRRRGPAGLVEWAGPVLLLAIIIGAAYGLYGACRPDVYEPLAAAQIMRVEPDPVRVGYPATLYNGICNSHPEDVLADRVTLFLETPDKPPTTRDRVELISRTDVTFEPGCHRETIPVTVVPSSIPVGTWRLVYVVEVSSPTGDGHQTLTERSEPFTVLR